MCVSVHKNVCTYITEVSNISVIESLEGKTKLGRRNFSRYDSNLRFYKTDEKFQPIDPRNCKL